MNVGGNPTLSHTHTGVMTVSVVGLQRGSTGIVSCSVLLPCTRRRRRYQQPVQQWYVIRAITFQCGRCELAGAVYISSSCCSVNNMGRLLALSCSLLCPDASSCSISCCYLLPSQHLIRVRISGAQGYNSFVLARTFGPGWSVDGSIKVSSLDVLVSRV